MPHERVLVGCCGAPDRRTVLELLETAGYELVAAGSDDELAESVAESEPDLVIIDGCAAQVPAAEWAERLKETVRARRLPVLILTHRGQALTDGDRTSWGGADCLGRPFRPDDLLARIKATLRIAYGEDGYRVQPMRDGLTKLYNRSYLDERLKREVERARRYRRQVSFVIVDVDGLQRINADHGHQAGDDTLRSVATVLLSETRSTDVVGRYGAEEFLLILPETEATDAAVLAERIRACFAGHVIEGGPEDLAPTVSCGVATYPDHAGDAATLLRMADSAAYQAKKEGGNRVAVAFAEKHSGPAVLAEHMAKILLVDGNEYSRSVTSVVLRASGYEVIEAADAVTAIALARTAKPDLVMMDVQLEGMGGLEATRRLLLMDETCNIPIVALTTSDMPSELARVVEAGCRGLITKPIDTNRLASQVEIYLDHT
jgi:diguanylate cyclase (GGDEF)-like protein